LPFVRDDVTMLAIPDATATGTPMGVVPSMKVMVPVTVEGVTLADNCTACPGLDDVGEAVSTVVVVALLTCWLTGNELLWLNVLSPE
jgi:hypothetical protein